MIDDLRHLPKQDDCGSFQFISPDLAVVILIVGMVLGYVLGALT